MATLSCLTLTFFASIMTVLVSAWPQESICDGIRFRSSSSSIFQWACFVLQAIAAPGGKQDGQGWIPSRSIRLPTHRKLLRQPYLYFYLWMSVVHCFSLLLCGALFPDSQSFLMRDLDLSVWTNAPRLQGTLALQHRIHCGAH
jgi:hypothetical protein